MEELATHILLTYPVIAPLSFVILRTLPIIVPPIPGIVLDFVGITIFGWLYGFILAGVGVMLGSMTSFYLARVYGTPLVSRFISLDKLHAWEAELSEHQKFWGLVLLRIVSSPAFDYVCYVAGLTRIKAHVFFWTTFVSAMPLGFLIYYFGDVSFARGPIGIGIYVVSFILLGLTMQSHIVKRATRTHDSV